MSTREPTSSSRARVAVIVVNGFRKRKPGRAQREAEAREYPWIGLCVRQVTRHSQGWDYEVFVYDNSHLTQHRELVSSFERVRLLPPAWVATLGRASDRVIPWPRRYVRPLERAHPKALDYLVGKVPHDFDYIVTLDNDSFPVRDDWLDVLVSSCERGAAVAGVYRDEMAPLLHPFVHVSGLCMRRRDLLGLDASFKDVHPMAGTSGAGRDEWTQDVGQKITHELTLSGREIAPLHRSNEVDFHFVMGGVYGDVIYHQGAGSRPLIFRADRNSDENQRISDTLRDAAFNDVDHLMAVLRGQAPNDLGLTPLDAHEHA